MVEEMSVVVESGPQQGLEIPLDREVLLVGRGDWCDLQLASDTRVSSEHCELRIGTDGIVLRDLKSSNGLFLKDVRVREAHWTSDTKLLVGNTILGLKSSARKRALDIHYADSTGSLVGKSDAMRKIFGMIDRLAARDIPVLLTGETGTGKTTVARAIHDKSLRNQAPFVVVNCGALPPSLVESFLFGHEKGAFTGADKTHLGFFEQANKGTLFLDEIGELPLELQPKLLSVLENKTFQRLGGRSTIQVDFRLVTATHRNLLQEVSQKAFREDLYYRVATVALKVPPLRERGEDLPLLIDALMETIATDTPIRFTKAAIAKLRTYLWPGNVRELRNILEQTLVFLDGSVVEASDIDLPKIEGEQSPEPAVCEQTWVESRSDDDSDKLHLSFALGALPPLKQMLESTEKTLIQRALENHGFDVQKTAVALAISLPWLYRRMKKYGIQRPK